MIRATKPKQFIESGTFKGYSAQFICEALKANDNEATFSTYGFDLENCLEVAKERLRSYSFAHVFEGDSRTLMNRSPKSPLSTAFFIDGPKGRNLPLLLFRIIRYFSNICFIAVHDCQTESGSGNRDVLLRFFDAEYPIMFCNTSFQEKVSKLDVPMIGQSNLVDWRPFHVNRKKQHSYGTETGYVLPMLGRKRCTVNLLPFYVRRYIRFYIYRRLRDQTRRCFHT